MSSPTASSALSVLDAFYQTAQFYREKGDYANAEIQLTKALELSLDHVESRLLLAEIHIENERIDEGLRELQQVYDLSEDAARGPLVVALLSKGAELSERGQEDAALEVYERALQLLPQDATVQQRVVDIWLSRAARFVEAGDLDAAIAAYSKAGRPDEVSRLEESKRQKEIGALAKKAEAYESQDRWQHACVTYRVLAKRDSANPAWPKALQKAEIEVQIAKAYRRASEARNEQEWRVAVESLQEIVAIRPDYRDSAERLAEAISRIKEQTPESASVAPVASTGEGGVPTRRPILRWALVIVMGAALVSSYVLVYELTQPLGGIESPGSIPPLLSTYLAEARIVPAAPLIILLALVLGCVCGWLLSGLRFRRVSAGVTRAGRVEGTLRDRLVSRFARLRNGLARGQGLSGDRLEPLQMK